MARQQLLDENADKVHFWYAAHFRPSCNMIPILFTVVP